MGEFITFLGNNLADFWTYTGFANATVGHVVMILVGLFFISGSDLRMVPTAHFFGHRCHDRLLRLDFQPQTDVGRCSCTVRYLWCLYARTCHRL